MIENHLTLAATARLLGRPRWRLLVLIWTGRFVPPEHTDAAGRRYWSRTAVLRWTAERSEKGGRSRPH